MVSSNISAARITGSPARIGKFLRHTNGRATIIIRETKTSLFVGVPGSELGWLDNVVKDTGCTKQMISDLPKYATALCGVKVTPDRKRWHEAGCKKCRTIRVQRQISPIAPKGNGKPVSVGKIEPGQEFSAEGVITSLEATRDRLYILLESVEQQINALKSYVDSKTKLAQLEQEVKERMAAAKKLIVDAVI